MSKEKFLKEVARQKGTKTNLKSNKVALSIVGDIDSEYNYLEQSYSEASYGYEFMQEWEDKILDFNNELSIAVDNYVINGAARGLEEAADNMRTKIDDLDRAANDIGINPETLVSNYQEIKDILSSSSEVDAAFKDAYQNVRIQANERFGLADFS
jgi:hypothetical protein